PAHHDLYRAIWRLNRELHALTGPIFSTIRLPVYVDGDEKKNLKERDFHLLTTVYRDNVYILAACVAEQSPGHPQRQTRVELRLDRLSERYLSRLGDSAEVLLEMAEVQVGPLPTYVKQARGTWRQVAINHREQVLEDVFGPYAVHVYRIPLSPLSVPAE
ncbi:unnamed protein product, partial [marine sediment metagenome]